MRCGNPALVLHGGLPLDYYNHCWHMNKRSVRVLNQCRVATMHATCGNNAGEKNGLMRSFLNKFNNCPLNNRTGRLAHIDRDAAPPGRAAQM